jgi:two-component system sensor histidine kinase VicK
MVVLVNELLNVSRLDSGVSKPVPKQIDAGKLLESVMADTTPLLTAKKQKFAFSGPNLPQIFVDELLIREVLVNLVSNASKYSPDGGKVTITAVPQDGMVQVAIKDDGIGIPKSDHSQLFKKFFRAGNALKSAVQGTGLGLYFVKSIVELSGGKIWFDSEENKGTTFFVTLPTGSASTASILPPNLQAK